MDGQITAIYCLCDDLLKALHTLEDRQRRMSDAEVMTTAIVAALHFHGNFERARAWLFSMHFIPCMLSKSRFNRRLHAVQDLLSALFVALGATFKQLNEQALYCIDSFPIAACDNIRLRDAHLYDTEAHRGYCASKRRYFYGVKLFLLTTARGQPVEAFLAPGSTADVHALGVFQFDLPAHSLIYADSAFTLYAQEDLMREAAELELQPFRKSNSTRPVPPWTAYLQARGRKIIETAGSQINQLLPKSIHAVTAAGFELKVMLFVLAYAIEFVA